MSFLDLDERLMELADKAQLVYSPFVDTKNFPDNVDITLVEGAVGNEEQLVLLKQVRKRTKILISFGDCAVTGNVSAMRNVWSDGDKMVLQRAYVECAENNQQIPNNVPKLLRQVKPLHEIVNVDFFIPGCPPPAGVIYHALTEILSGRAPNMEGRSKYG
jgi:NAD-reducing hydrogenase small subunit